MFLSAFSPVLITLAYIKYDAGGLNSDVVGLLVIGVLGSTIPFLVIKLIRQSGESFTLQIKKVESSDFMLIAFVASYLAPFAVRAVELSFGAIMAVVAIIGVVMYMTSSLPSHPLLRIIKYRFYKIETSSGMVYALISRNAIIDPKKIGRVKKISENMLLED